MTDAKDSVRSLISQEAADWLVINRSDTTATERTRFFVWLTSSRLHVEEYLALASISRDFSLKVADPRFDLEQLIERARTEVPEAPPAQRPHSRPELRAWRPLAVAAGIAALGVVGLLAWSAWTAKTERERLARAEEPGVVRLAYTTRRGERATEQLPDGSVLHLNADSSVTILYGRSIRSVTLGHGRADFQVAHDPGRAFTVLNRSAEITAVGTNFDVDVEGDATVITVLEGQVTVAPASNVAEARLHKPSVQVSANQQLSVSDRFWPEAPTTVDAQRETAWLRGQIVVDKQPLERITQEFNREASTHFEIVTPELRQLRVSAVFSTDDPESLIAFLRSLDGVRVDVTPTRVLVSRELRGSRPAR